MASGAARWRAQVEAADAASDVIAHIPPATQWGVAITDEDTRVSPPTLNIFAYDQQQVDRLVESLSQVLPNEWRNTGEALTQRVNGLLVSIIRQWEAR